MADAGSGLSGEAKNQKPARTKLKWYWKLGGFLFFGYTMIYMLMPALNSFGIESIQCEVSAARPNTSSGGTRGSASTAGVLIETTNCGKIYVSEGINFDNQDDIAASFKAGSQYEFDLGWFSRVVTKDLRQGIPSVRDYRLVE